MWELVKFSFSTSKSEYLSCVRMDHQIYKQTFREAKVSKQQFKWIYIVVDPDINILLGFCQFGFILTQSSLRAENCCRYEPAWSQLDVVRNYLED